ncbi:hypothetical protein F511_17623 [Dorcoceras hygrometricum]|uniref:Uncharacterized protein n=1 Tax=Dorcoceras hygrometricum TaxID=472368 RepID=A0A2Z7CB79_9LAMI|nr:hypothetical protein F511_17623 [Dorcoceras hygrometricum]
MHEDRNFKGRRLQSKPKAKEVQEPAQHRAQIKRNEVATRYMRAWWLSTRLNTLYQIINPITQPDVAKAHESMTAVDPPIRFTTGINLPPSICTRRLDGFATDGITSARDRSKSDHGAAARDGAAVVRGREVEERWKGGRVMLVEASTCVTLNGLEIQLAMGPQPLRLPNHNFGLAQRIMVKRLATSPHDPLVARDPIAMQTSWRSNSDIAIVTSIGYPRMKSSVESSTTKHRLLHASGSHPIPPPYDPKIRSTDLIARNTAMSTLQDIKGCSILTLNPQDTTSKFAQGTVELPVSWNLFQSLNNQLNSSINQNLYTLIPTAITILKFYTSTQVLTTRPSSIQREMLTPKLKPAVVALEGATTRWFEEPIARYLSYDVRRRFDKLKRCVLSVASDDLSDFGGAGILETFSFVCCPFEAVERLWRRFRSCFFVLWNPLVLPIVSAFGAFRQLLCWRLGAWLRQVSRGNRHFTVGGDRLRQAGPRPEGRLLRQPALEGLTRSAWMDSPRKVGRNKFQRGAAAQGSDGGGFLGEEEGVCEI